MKQPPAPRRGGASSAVGASVAAATPATNSACGFKLSVLALTVAGALFSSSAHALTIYEFGKPNSSNPSVQTYLTQGNGYYHFSGNEDLVVTDSYGVANSDGKGDYDGYGLITENQVFHVGADFGSADQSWAHAVDLGPSTAGDTAAPDFLIRGTGTSVSVVNGQISEKGGLAVIAVNGQGSSLRGKTWLDVSGYALISAENVDLSFRFGTINPNTVATGSGWTAANTATSLLVFQNQNQNGGAFSINDLVQNDKRLSQGGIYVDTTDSSVKFSAATVSSNANVVVDLNNQDFSLQSSTLRTGYQSHDNSVVSGEFNVIFNKKDSGTGSAVLSGKSAVISEVVTLTGGATVKVDADSTVRVGTIGASAADAALTLGGEGFALGKAITGDDGTIIEEGANGLFDVTGNVEFVDGDYYFEGTTANPEEGIADFLAGITATGSINGTAGTVSLDHAQITTSSTSDNINLKVSDLTLTNGSVVYVGTKDTKGGNVEILSTGNLSVDSSAIGRNYGTKVVYTDDVPTDTGYSSKYPWMQGSWARKVLLTGKNIAVTDGILAASTSVTLKPYDEDSHLTIDSSGIFFDWNKYTSYGIRTNNAIIIGEADRPFASVTLKNYGFMRADGVGGAEATDGVDLTIYSKQVVGSQYAQYVANKKALIFTDKIDMSLASYKPFTAGDVAKTHQSMIKGGTGLEITELSTNDSAPLTITLNHPNSGAYDITYVQADKTPLLIGQYVDIKGVEGVSVTGGVIEATGNSNDDFSIRIGSETGNVSLDSVWTDAGVVRGGKVEVTANKGNTISIKRSQLRDDADESGEGTLTIKINDMDAVSGKVDIAIANSTLSDDAIYLGSGYEKITYTGNLNPDTKLEVRGSEFSGRVNVGANDYVSPGVGSGTVDFLVNKVDLTSSIIKSDTHVGFQSSYGNHFDLKMDDASTITGNDIVVGPAGNGGNSFTVTGGTITTNDADGQIRIFAAGSSSISGTNVASQGGSVKVQGVGEDASLTLKNNGDENNQDPAVISAGSVDVSGLKDLIVEGNSQGAGANDSHIESTGNISIAVSGRVDLGAEGWIKGGGAVNIQAPTLTMEDGSHIGTDGDENEGGKVSITANDVTVGADSYITSSDDVNITTESADGKLSITMNGASSDTADGWIKGDSVNIGGLTTNPGHLPEEGSSPTISISGGSITATGTSGGTGSGEINIAIGGNGTSSESENTVNGTQIGTGDESIKVAGNGSLAIDNGASVVGDSVTVEAPSLVMDNGSHIGSDEDGTSTGGDVKISANDVTVGDDSYITSEGAVSVTAKDPSKDLSIEMTGGVDGATEEGWIKGDSVTIGSNKQEGTTTVAGGSITSTGNTGIKIEVGDNGKLDLTDTQLDSTGSVTIIGAGSVAGSDIAAGGDVVFGEGPGNKEHFVDVTGGTSISGNGLTVEGDTTLNLGNKDDASDSNTVNIDNGGEVTVEGELNIAGDNNIKSEGDLTINTGTTGNGTVNVAEGGSITAGANGEGETGNTGDMTITGNGTVNVAGGKLEANGDGNGDGGNVNVIGADVNLSTGEGGKAGSIVAGGFVTVGGEDSNGQDLGGSINVDAGETGVIIAGGDDGSGNNVVVGNGGQLNVADDGTPEGQGSLIISGNDKVEKPAQGGLTIDTDTTVSVGEGGHVSSGDISFGKDDDGNTTGKLEISNGGGIHTSVDTVLEETGSEDSGLVIGDGSSVQISGQVDKDKLDQVHEIVGDNVNLIVDQYDGYGPGDVITEDEMMNDFHGAVMGDATIDVTEGSNDLTVGGGGSIMVAKDPDATGGVDGTLTIKPNTEDDRGVIITGSEDGDDQAIVVGKGENGKPDADGVFDIDLGDGADLTLGKDGAQGGTLSGSITATTSEGNENLPSDVTVNGGNFNIGGNIDLTHSDANGQNPSTDDDGNIIIRDQNTKDPGKGNGLTVGGNVAAGNLEMTGDNTNFDVAGSVDLSGDATLTGGADADVVGSMDVGGDLDLSGTASLGKGEQTSQEAKPDLTVGGNLDITDSASVDRNDVDVNGNAHINGNGGLTADGNFDVAGELQIGTGEDIDGNETAAGNPTVNVSGGNLTTGTPGSTTAVDNGNLTIGQGTVNVTGNSPDEGNIIVGSTDAGGQSGDLIVGNEGDTPKTPANVNASNNITVSDGNATIHDNGHVTAGGSFVVNGTGEKGDLSVAGELNVGDDLKVVGETEISGTVNVSGQGSFGNGLTIADGAHYNDGKDFTLGDSDVEGGLETDVTGNLVVGGKAPAEGTDDRTGATANLGDVSVSGTTELNKGTTTTGDFTGKDDFTANAGSDFTAQGDLTLDGDKSPDLIVNGGSVSAETTGEGGTAHGGNIDVAGNISVSNDDNNAGSVSAEGNITAGGKVNVSSGSLEAGGNLQVNGADGLVVGSIDEGNVTEGTVNVGGELNVSSGNVDIIGGSVTTGTADLGQHLIVGNEDSNKDPNGSFTSQGSTNVSGNVVVNDNGELSVGMNPSGDDQGKLTIDGTLTTGDGSQTTVGGDLAVTGDASINGSSDIVGKLTVNGTGGLTVGDNTNYDENGDEITGGALEQDTTVTVGSITVNNGPTKINGDGKLEANGEAAFGGGLQLGAGGAFVNNSDKATTVGGEKGGFTLDAGSSVTTNGVFAFGEGIGNQVGTSDATTSGTLNGTITAGSIDFSEYTNNTITFAGDENTSGDEGETSRFEAGFETGSLTGNVALSNGANAVLTPSADGEAPLVNGWINVNAGEKDEDGTIKKYGNTLATNAANKGDYSNADVASGNSTNALVNMDSSINFNTSEGKSSGLIVGDVGTSTPSESGIYFGANSSLVIDASNMTSGSVLFGNGTADGMDIKVVGDNTTVSIDLSGWTMGTSGSLVFDVAEADEGKFEFTSSNVLQQFGIDDGKIQMTVADIGDATGNTLDSSLQDVVGKVTANAGNTYVGQAFNEVFSSASGLTALDPNNEQDKAVIDDLTASGAVPDGATNIIKTPFGYQYTKDGKTVLALNGNGNKAVEEIATFPVTAGAFNATYEYLTEFNRAVETRALEDRPEGRSQSVWAHVIATFNKSDELFGGSGYSADLYGGVLGTDVVVGGNTLVGGALTVGNGDIESRGAVIDSKNDATFYGVSLYAEHNIGAMSVKGDVTYLKTENDISSTFNGVNMGGSMDTDAISVGIRAEFKAYESDSFEVKPHLGIRYTNYSFDNYRGTDIDDVNAIESPVGVAFSGKVKAEGGWTVVPELDLSVVPQLGDRKATVVNAGTGVDQTILEGAIFNAKLGLGLTKDNFSFGLNYQHGAGGFGRNNNAFQAHARWLF